MKPVAVEVAKTQLSRLIERACAGEDVVIAKARVPVVRLVPVTPRKRKRVFGAMRGRATVDSTFFAPLPREEQAAWEG